ncbi:MAG: hypothetical protein CSA64_01645 [Arachnia propionica]|nr:MAG: hypothetical protein CSA64_01645 [Arachnia propionica]
MKERLEKILRFPPIAHALAANERFSTRLGPQFAAAVTYYSVLSLVPVLMFAISALGMTLTVLRPDLLPGFQAAIAEQSDGGGLPKSMGQLMDYILKSWRSIGLVALLIAAYSGSNWIGNLKRAFKALWKDRFSEAAKSRGFLIELLVNIATFFGLLVVLGVAIAVNSAVPPLLRQIIELLGLGDVPGATIALRVAGLLVGLLATWLVMAYIFLVFPGERVPWRLWLAGTLLGAALLLVLLQLSGLLVSVFANNRATAVFGPVIVLMLLFNLVATIMLMSSAWVGSAESWQQKDSDEEATQTADEAAAAEPGNDAEPEQQPRPRRAAPPRQAATIPLDQLRAENFDPSQVSRPSEERLVSEQVAVRSANAGRRIGYALGAATGVGIGALLTSLSRWLSRR